MVANGMKSECFCLGIYLSEHLANSFAADFPQINPRLSSEGRFLFWRANFIICSAKRY
ncbi:MAG: hypothetical protein ACUVWV_00705 [Thermodesulfobacteriota bacterium]